MAFNNPRKPSAYVLTPKGESIAKDESNVGQQMLKKMGWLPDTGLGKESNGIVDPIKANSNFGRKGLGKGPTQSSTGMVQQSAFNAILQSLSKHKTKSESRQKTKLEAKSKQSRSRVHYGKFVRAKDVSQYSKESLKVVLGESHDSASPVSEDQDGATSAPEDLLTKSTTIKNEFGVNTYSSTTDLNSYFSMKIKALTEADSGSTPVTVKREYPSSDDERTCFSMNKNSSPEGRVSFQLKNENNEDIKMKPEPVDEETPLASKQDEDTNAYSQSQYANHESGHRKSAAFATSNLHSLAGYRYY